MQIDGRLWNLAKVEVGSRNSRKRDARKLKVRAVTRVREKYEELLAKMMDPKDA